MKCEIAIQNIDQYFNKELGELDPETTQHLAGCMDCNMHFMAQKKAKELVTRIIDFEPVLSDPSGLTDDIMMALGDASAVPETNKNIKPAGIFQNVFFRWSLSAAAIILFALFGFEQYLVLDKINRLETQYQNIPEAKFSRQDMNTFNSWGIRKLRNINHLKANNKELFEKISSVTNNI